MSKSSWNSQSVIRNVVLLVLLVFLIGINLPRMVRLSKQESSEGETYALSLLERFVEEHFGPEGAVSSVSLELCDLLTKEKRIVSVEELIDPMSERQELLKTQDDWGDLERVTHAAGLRLTGIIFEQGQSYAVINDNVYTIGDDIGDMKILAISRGSVLVGIRDKEVVLELEEFQYSQEGSEDEEA